ncbi:MAG: LacI family transcriptional regulator [Bacteroidales bacterium]|jgi:LacI family transcriptional regulator|nr:LacI family transcriptional regulator [Bacteroidales bacterium]
MMGRVSIKDIAGKTGVSTATVSLVLNGKDKCGRISEALSEKIRETAKSMNYKPNGFAKALRSGRSETIGLVVADISNPFFAHLAFHIQEHADGYGYSVIITNTNESTEKMEKRVAILKCRQVDGFIVVPTENGNRCIEELHENNIPVVLLDRYFPEMPSHYVGVSNFHASLEATEYLLTLGCRKIALFTYKTTLRHAQERRDGYVAALASRNLYDSRLIKEVNHSTITEDINRSVQELISGQNEIDGIFFTTNTISSIGLKKLREMQVHVPNDIKVICFDKSESFAFSNIPFVQQPIAEMGRQAVDIIVEQIRDRNQSPVHVELKTELIV